jgi:hypothetical protein
MRANSCVHHRTFDFTNVEYWIAVDASWAAAAQRHRSVDIQMHCYKK